MLKLGNDEYLYLLALAPVLIFLFYYMRFRRRKTLGIIGDSHLMEVLTKDVSEKKRLVKFWLLISVVLLLVFSLANPLTGSKIEEVKRRGVEIVIALDVSNSMMAEDIQPSRLEAAKRAIEKLADKFSNDRLALIVFAGEAYIQLPITSDMTSAKMFLKSINTGTVPEQGTSLSKAIETGMRAFTGNPETGKVLILITDGEDHEGQAIEAASLCKEKNIVIHVVGMGLPQGAPIPVYNKYGKVDYKTDNEGRVVVSKLNEQIMQQIAAAGGGSYIRANTSLNMLNRISEEIDKMNLKDEKTSVFSEFDHQYQYFLGLALLLLIVEALISERKKRESNMWGYFVSKLHFKPRNLMLIILLLSVSNNLMSQEAKKQIRQGNKYYEQKKYDRSEVEYRKAQKLSPKSFKANFNLGDAIYKQDKFEEAEKKFKETISQATNKEELAKLYYNLGNTLLMQSKIDESIEAYKNSLRLKPNDQDTKYNLSYALNLKAKSKNKDKNKDQKNIEPSEYAKKLKEKATLLVSKGKFSEAYAMMNDGLKKDETVAAFSDFIEKIGKVVEIEKNY